MTNDLNAIRAKATDPRATVSPVGTTTVLSLCDEVQSLRGENERLREAAEHFATWDQCWPGNINLKGACEKIRAALSQKEGE